MRTSCWWKGRRHCWCRWTPIILILQSKCKTVPKMHATKGVCCNCSKTVYSYRPTTDFSYRIAKRSIDWLATAELALGAQKA